MNIDTIQPKEVFHWFAEISAVPRGSHNEKGISDFLVRFAKERSLEVYQDEALNIIIKKPGTAGYEKAPTVILQGHMDMVCEKTGIRSMPTGQHSAGMTASRSPMHWQFSIQSRWRIRRLKSYSPQPKKSVWMGRGH